MGNPRLPASPFASDLKQAARFIERVSRELLRGPIYRFTTYEEVV
jgi:hypothetical protein